MWVLETIINIITFLKVKLVFHRYNKMVRCSSCISMGNSFIKEKIWCFCFLPFRLFSITH